MNDTISTRNSSSLNNSTLLKISLETVTSSNIIDDEGSNNLIEFIENMLKARKDIRKKLQSNDDALNAEMAIVYEIKLILNIKKIKSYNLKTHLEHFLETLFLIENTYRDNLKEVALKFYKGKEFKFISTINLTKIEKFFLKYPDVSSYMIHRFFQEFQISIAQDELSEIDIHIFLNLSKPTNEIVFLRDEKRPELCNSLLEEIGKIIYISEELSDILIKRKKLSKILKMSSNEKENSEIRKFLKDNLAYNENIILTGNEIEDSKKIKSSIDEFFKENINENNYELIQIYVIEIFSEIFHFHEFGSYFNLFTYDNCKKLKDHKNFELIKKKIRENKEVNKYFKPFLVYVMVLYYEMRKRKFKGIIRKTDISIHQLSNNSASLNNTNKITSSNKISDSELDSTEDTQDLTSINYSESDKDDTFNNIISTIFFACRMKFLNELEISQNQITPTNILYLLDPLKVNKSIKKLLLSMNRIGSEGCWALGRALHFNKKILDLDVSSTLLGDEDLKYFLPALGSEITSLIKINLSKNNLTHLSGRAIADIVKKSPNLKHLNLSKCYLEHGFNLILMTILDLIKSNKSKLSELLATCVKMDTKGLSLISDIVAEPDCPITSLVLSENNFELNAGNDFFKSMEQNNSIRELILTKCQIDNEMAQGVYEMLQNNQSLISVSFHDNKINHQIDFIKILSVCLNYNQITPKDSEIEFISRNTLRNLDLSANKCRLDFDDYYLLKILGNLDIDMLDISGNIDKHMVSDKFIQHILQNDENTKVLY